MMFANRLSSLALLSCLAATATFADSARVTTAAVNARFSLDIPAQTLESALQAVALAVNGKMLYERELLNGKTSARLQGQFTTEEAIRALLSGTNLTYEFTSSSVVLIRRKGESTVQPTVTGDNLSQAADGLRLVSVAATPADSVLQPQDDQAEVATATADGASGQAGATDIVVFGERILTRNREDTVEPVLVYSSGYFERFEPLTLSDMLKRVPGVYFDKLFNLPNNATGSAFADTNGTMPRFRNMDSQFSQILVNGRRIAGIDFGDGGDAFLQTIPADSIREIRVIRSPSAEIDSSGVAMTLDVILKDGSRYGGNSWRVAGSYVDHELDGMGSTSVRGGTDRFSYAFSATAQNRYGSGYSINNSTSNTAVELGSFQASTQSTDRTTATSGQIDEDRSVIGNVGMNIGRTGKLGMEAKFMQTDYTANINLVRDSDSTRITQFGSLPPTTTHTVSTTAADSEQRRDTSNYGMALTYAQDLGTALRWSAMASYDRTDLESTNTGYEDDAGVIFASDIALARGKGQRYQLDNHLSWQLAPEHELRLGADLQKSTDRNQNAKRSNFSSAPDDGFDTIFSEDQQTIKRRDLFAVYEWRMDNGLSLQFGARHEGADYDSNAPARLVMSSEIEAAFQFDPQVLSPNRRTPFAATVGGVNPSVHLRWEFMDNQDIRLSVAQTVRRPHLGELDPRVYITASDDGGLDNQVEVGNPDLSNEESLGFDLGYDWRFTDGIIGINFFHRSVENLIQQGSISAERFQTLRPDLTSEIERFALFMAEEFPLGGPVMLVSYVNTGEKTRVHGAELDMSFPLNFISRDAHFYMNATYSRRRTGDQPSVESSAVNFSYDHLIQSLGFTYGLGMNWITKNKTHFEIFGSLVNDSERELEPNFEIFLEKKFGDSLLARLTMENATDAVDESNTVNQLLGISSGTLASHRQTQSDPRILFTLRGKF